MWCSLSSTFPLNGIVICKIYVEEPINLLYGSKIKSSENIILLQVYYSQTASFYLIMFWWWTLCHMTCLELWPLPGYVTFKYQNFKELSKSFKKKINSSWFKFIDSFLLKLACLTVIHLTIWKPFSFSCFSNHLLVDFVHSYLLL